MDEIESLFSSGVRGRDDDPPSRSEPSNLHIASCPARRPLELIPQNERRWPFRKTARVGQLLRSLTVFGSSWAFLGLAVNVASRGRHRLAP